MHPGDDPKLSAHFLDWLRARGEFRDETPGDVARLNEMGAWPLPTADVARPEMPEAERDRLVALHVAWRQFCDQQDADWIGRSDAADGDVTWIDADGSRDRVAPAGSAPALVPAGRRGSAPQGSPLRGVGPALLLPLCFAAVGLLLHVAESASEASLAEGIRQAQQRVAPGRAPGLERVARQRALARTLVAVRRQQRDLVNARCEAGAWCDARVEARTRSLRMAEQFLANAEAWPVPKEDLPEASGDALLPGDIGELERERLLLSAGQPADPAENPVPTQPEIARRLALVEAELDLVRGVQP